MKLYFITGVHAKVQSSQLILWRLGSNPFFLFVQVLTSCPSPCLAHTPLTLIFLFTLFSSANPEGLSADIKRESQRIRTRPPSYHCRALGKNNERRDLYLTATPAAERQREGGRGRRVGRERGNNTRQILYLPEE